MIRFLAEKTAAYVTAKDAAADFEELAYGFDLIYQRAAVILATLLAAVPFRLVPHVAITLLIFDLLRSYAGGTHAKYRIVCILTSDLTIFAPALLFEKFGLLIHLSAYPFLFLFCLVSMLLYAPADTAIRPVQNPQKRKRMKTVSILILTAYFLIACLLYNRLPVYSCIFVTIPTIVSCYLHPLAYQLYGCEKYILTLEE